MIENNPDKTTSESLVITAFERMPTAKKMELMEEFIGSLTQDLSRLSDPALDGETDNLYDIWMNIETRLEEIKAVYGVE